MSDESARVVRIERTFAASAEEVFDACTSPDVMRRWFHCDSAWDTPIAEVDLQVGGKIRVVMRRPDGTEIEAQGIFTLIHRPHRLVMTWAFDDDPSNEQLLELSFNESKGATTVLLVNSRISTDERRNEQAKGWQGCLDELDRLLASWIRSTHSRVRTAQSAKRAPSAGARTITGMTRSVSSTYCDLREPGRSAPTKRLPSAAAVFDYRSLFKQDRRSAFSHNRRASSTHDGCRRAERSERISTMISHSPGRPTCAYM